MTTRWPHRFRARYSLTTLFVGVTSISIFLGGAVVQMRRIEALRHRTLVHVSAALGSSGSGACRRTPENDRRENCRQVCFEYHCAMAHRSRFLIWRPWIVFSPE